MPISAPAFGGVAAEELAERYGTPLLVIDTDVLDRNVRRFEDLADAYGVATSYAGKAFLVTALARRLARSSIDLDVCSLGELLTAERAAFPAERLVFHGCGKSADEVRAIVAGRVGRVVVDGFEEIERLRTVARGERTIRILLRVNPGIVADTHVHVRTGGEDSKFGVGLADVPAAIAAIGSIPGARLVGLHAHLGSQLFEPAAYAACLDVLLERATDAARAGMPLAELVVGGGFGVDSRTAETLDPATVARELARTLADGCAARGIPVPKLGVEPGRAIVAEAGTSLYRVLAVKRRGERRFAIVDGGIADNPRPALYGAIHPARLVGRTSSAPTEAASVCGRSCENDRLVDADLPGDLASGDLLALAMTGAYTYSMASNYNRFPKPAVAFAGAGRHRLVARRETDAEVLRLDVDDDARA